MRNDVFQDCISALMCWASMILYTDWLPAFYRYWTWLMNNGRPTDCACECKSMQKLRWCFSELSPSLIRNITHVVFCMTFSLLYMTIHSQHIFCGPDSAGVPGFRRVFSLRWWPCTSEAMFLESGGDVPGHRRHCPWTPEAMSLDTRDTITLSLLRMCCPAGLPSFPSLTIAGQIKYRVENLHYKTLKLWSVFY